MEVPLLQVRKPLFLVTASAASSSRSGVRKSNLLLTDASPGCKEHMSMIRTSIQVCPRYLYYRNYLAAASKKVVFSIQNTSVSIQHETKESVESTSKGHPVSGDGIRRRFLEFYASRGHKVLPSASLVPDDPTVLLTIAGMLQFKPIFLGKVWLICHHNSAVISKAISIGTSNIRVLVESMDDMDSDSLKSAAEYVVDSLQDPVAVVLGSCPGEGKVSLAASFTPGIVDLGIEAGKFIGPIAKICGGGGGRPNFAQAGGRKPENLLNALEKARIDLIATLSEKAS